MAMARDAWIEYMARLQKDWHAYDQEFDRNRNIERGPDACVVDDFLRSLLNEWAKRGRKGW
jgi:hypothetical protein